MKRYGAAYASLVICLFLLFCASCRPLLSRISSQTCSEVTSGHAIVSLSNPTPDGWARYSPAGLNLSIALPGEPRPTPISKSESARRNGWKITAYSYTDKQVFAFLVCNTSSDGRTTSKILKELTDGFLNGYKKSDKDAQFTTEADSPCRISIKGSYKLNDRDVEMEGFSQAQGANVWVLVFSHARSYSEGQTFVKNAEESVRFE